MKEIDLNRFHSITQLQAIHITESSFKQVGGGFKRKMPSLNYVFQIDNILQTKKDVITKDLIINVTPAKKRANMHLHKKEENLAHLHLSFVFHVKKLSTHIHPNAKGKFEIEPNLSTWLNHVIIATGRGILYSELSGRFKKDILLPLINPGEIRSTALRAGDGD